MAARQASGAVSIRERPYGGKGPAARKGERRERLVGAGLSLIGTRGFPSTTIPEICAEAGVTPRHFYDEFDGKEAWLRAVYDRVIAETRDAVIRALAGASDDPHERTRVSLEAFLHSYLGDPRRGRVACVEIVGVSPELERHRRTVIHEFAAVIEHEARRSLAQRKLPERDLRLASIAMAGATNELVIEWLTSEHPPKIEDIRDVLVSLFVAMNEGAEAGVKYVERVGSRS
jgi:AcrR family transcriptional regulator